MNINPVRVRAERTLPLSRWLWLVKWLLLIPHYLVLLLLWVGFFVTTLIAYVAVLFTGRYPRAMHDFNVGVLRWSWRVDYYGYEVLGTDRYPPFTLDDVPDYPARLEVDHPASLPRWRPLVAIILAIPHLLIVGVFVGASTWSAQQASPDNLAIQVPVGLISLLTLIAAVALLFTSRYPQGLYDLLIGLNRWIYRVIAYTALLTDVYPPFRLDQGDHEPEATS